MAILSEKQKQRKRRKRRKNATKPRTKSEMIQIDHDFSLFRSFLVVKIAVAGSFAFAFLSSKQAGYSLFEVRHFRCRE